jgi:hypothetical protein
MNGDFVTPRRDNGDEVALPYLVHAAQMESSCLPISRHKNLAKHQKTAVRKQDTDIESDFEQGGIHP